MKFKVQCRKNSVNKKSKDNHKGRIRWSSKGKKWSNKTTKEKFKEKSQKEIKEKTQFRKNRRLKEYRTIFITRVER